MGDAALRADPLDDAAHPRHRALRAGAVEGELDVLASGRGKRRTRRPARIVLDVDVCRRPRRSAPGCGRAARRARTPASRRTTCASRPPGARGPPASPSSSSPGRPRARAGPGAAPRTAPPGSPRPPRSAVPTCVERAPSLVADRPVHQRAQVQRVGPALDEGRPVRGVLHAVGEDECLLLLRGDVRAAEQLPERRRGQRGHPRTEEADAVRSPARRALLVLRGLRVGRDDHRDVSAVAAGRVGRDVGGLRVDPHDVRRALGRLARREDPRPGHGRVGGRLAPPTATGA